MRHVPFCVVSLCVLLAGSAAADDAFITTPDGATLSATVALPEVKTRIPAILVFDIYTRPDSQQAQAQEFAARGYAGIVADVRGKRLSPESPVPYERDADDTRAVIDWIVRQPWSNGQVGMIGGSYSGFTAWAATKRLHPALKAIAVSAAAIPGQGLPMYNNVFLTANYAWAFYVTNNKLLDERLYADGDRWSGLGRKWFASGRPYRELDAVDGTPNPWLQRWLAHPAYDAYWQAMVPCGRDFARIDIPVLSITGYYDDGQISALKYFTEHYKHRPGAEHYLVVGPYEHFGTHARKKTEVVRDYPIDPVAQFDSQELKLAFMDHVLRGAPLPAMLADRVNYQVMGGNEWRHAASLAGMHRTLQRRYFSPQKIAQQYSLVARAPARGDAVTQVVDLADRLKLHGFHTYPDPIIQPPLAYVTEAVFRSEPFAQATTVSGSFSGELRVAINKLDFDYTVTVYEAMPDGRLFHLGYSLNRASYARDATRRQLLTPGKQVRLPFTTTLVSRRMRPGSALLVLVDGSKHPMAQTNYGTGRDVSDESIADAGTPLQIRIGGGSYLDIPIDR